MKFIKAVFLAGALAIVSCKATAAPSDLDLGFKLIHSAEFDAYSQTSEARGLSLKGIEWAEEGADQKGNLVIYKLTFVKVSRDRGGKISIQTCKRAAKVYFNSSADGSRVYTGADFANMDLECQ